MAKEQDKNVIVTELFLDTNSEECKKEDAVKVYVRLTDSNGNYIHAEMIPLK